jgi:hypothetical protein
MYELCVRSCIYFYLRVCSEILSTVSAAAAASTLHTWHQQTNQTETLDIFISPSLALAQGPSTTTISLQASNTSSTI